MKNVDLRTNFYCKQLTYEVKPHECKGKSHLKNCKYEVHDYCTGNKVVYVTAGSVTHKFHDGCLRKISYELGDFASDPTGAVNRVKYVIIDDYFDPDIVTMALKYILKPTDHFFSLDTEYKYGMMLFGARYGLPPEHMSKLIDRYVYADLVQYAFEENGVYLMEMLPKVRIPQINFAKDFKNVDKNIMIRFVREYDEHEKLLEKCRRYKINTFVILSLIFLILFCLAYQYDDEWHFGESNTNSNWKHKRRYG